MKTADEILTEFGCPEILPFNENVTMYYPAIISAMQEYAAQPVEINLPTEEEGEKWVDREFKYPATYDERSGASDGIRWFRSEIIKRNPNIKVKP